MRDSFTNHLFIITSKVGLSYQELPRIEEEDVCGRIEFGFMDNRFKMDIEEYFLKFEDKCSQSHKCLGRIRAVSSDRKDLAWTPRNIIDLLEKHGDGHVIDTFVQYVQ